ncbi:MAG: hypothetical protein Q7S91_08630 [Aquabacterium sp.]|nr:hypothetical protein [Aquabacterium sp.]
MSFHQYRVNELHSNPSGTIQFIELAVGNVDGESFWTVVSISTTRSGVTHTFTLPGDLPSTATAYTLNFGGAALISYVALPDDGMYSVTLADDVGSRRRAGARAGHGLVVASEVRRRGFRKARRPKARRCSMWRPAARRSRSAKC